MFPAIMKQLVTTNCIKIKVRIFAMVSASLLDLPDFSPSAFAHTLHHFFIYLTTFFVVQSIHEESMNCCSSFQFHQQPTQTLLYHYLQTCQVLVYYLLHDLHHYKRQLFEISQDISQSHHRQNHQRHPKILQRHHIQMTNDVCSFCPDEI